MNDQADNIMTGVQRMEITTVHWVVFIIMILFFLALDLGVFHRHARKVRFKEALAWTGVWFSFAMLFGRFVSTYRGREEGMEFVTGYIIEVSLSMDNVFVIALIFTYFRVPLLLQHRVLFWGIMGALVMRLAMILAGAALISRFQQILYGFGAFLVYSGIKMLFVDDDGVEPEKNPCIRLARKWFPVTADFEGQRFLTKMDGKRALTPLALVLVMIETTDLIFALDSIPAIFAVAQKEFIVFTSNVFAILGLRSMYFVLANAIDYFRLLKYGLSIVLVFIGAKMLLEKWMLIETVTSLYIVASVILGSMVLSVVTARKHPDPALLEEEDEDEEPETGTDAKADTDETEAKPAV